MTGIRIHSPAEMEEAPPRPIFSVRPQLAAPYFIASATFNQVRRGNCVRLGVSPLLTGRVYYFWYMDDQFVGRTASAFKTFVLTAGDQTRMDVLQSNDPLFDAITHAPVGFPARRTLRFIRSLDPSIDRYRIEQQTNGGAWAVLGFVQDDAKRWAFQYQTPRLDDLTTYAWRVVPLDRAGNEGNPASLGSELIVRTPDGPNFTATFVQADDQILFAEVA